jgi:hypothetical protein
MTYNRFSGYGDNGGIPIAKFTPAVATTAKPINRKPKRDDDNDDVVIPADKRVDPFAKMLDRQALAHQAQFGGSYEQAYTKVYCDPSNRSIVDAARYEHLAKAYDAYDGGQRSMSNMAADIRKRVDELTLDKQARERAETTGETFAKAYTEIYTAPENTALRNGTADPLAKAAGAAELLGPNHARLHSLAVDHMRAHSGMSYEAAYSHLYSRPENAGLRNAVKAEHMASTMAGYRNSKG